MTTREHTYWAVHCDDGSSPSCNGSFAANDEHEARLRAREVGWRFREDRAQCPECQRVRTDYGVEGWLG